MACTTHLVVGVIGQIADEKSNPILMVSTARCYEVGEGAKPTPKIVQTDAAAQLVQGLDQALCIVQVGYRCGFGDFDDQSGWG